jgi:hypothetical protein
VPAKQRAWGDDPVATQRLRQDPAQRREHSPISPADPRLRLVRRRTATSCRKTSISAFFDADDLASSTSQDSTTPAKR